MNNNNWFARCSGVVLAFVIGCSLFFVYWIFTPFPADKAFILEGNGHQNFADKKYDESYQNFIKSAELSDDNILQGKRYGYAATAGYYAGLFPESFHAAVLSLRIEPGNKRARGLIKKMLFAGQIPARKILELTEDNADEGLFSEQQVLYQNRFSDGWSRGR